MNSMDPSQIHRFMRVYRAAKTARNVKRGYRKAKSMLDDHAGQTDLLLDAAELVGRVRDQQVRPEDIHNAGRAIINSAPRVYKFIARHVRKQQGNAKT